MALTRKQKENRYKGNTKNPPTPAFAKAGAAPGTTAGVELFRAHSPLSLGHSRQLPPRPLAGSLCCSRVAACPLPAHPSRQLPPRGSCHQALWPSAFQHCSLPFACTEPSLVPQQAQHAPLPHAKATTRPQQWLKGTPRPQQWLLIRVQGCRLPGLKRSKTLQNPPNPPTVRPAPQGKGTPTSPTRATPARKSHHKATAMAQGHPTAAAMASYTRSRLPFARPQTLQNPPNPPKVRPAPQGKGTPTSPTRATAARKSHHKATAMAQGHPTAAAMASYTRSRLPFARPQTLQNPPKPSKPSKSPASSAGKRYPNKPNTRHSRTQKPPQGHSNGSRAPHGRSNGFLYAFKAAVCQASNAPKPSKPSKSPASSARKRYPNKPNTRHSRTQKPPQGHSNGSRAPHGRSNGFLYAFKAAVCQASNAPKPSKTLQKSGQLRREKVPQQAQHAPLPHAKATTRPQQWLKGTPRPQQWLLIRVQGCRLPGLKRSKTLQNPPNPPKSPASSAGKRYPNKPNTRHCRTQKPPQGHSNGSRAPHGRSNGFLYAFKAAVCQASNAPKPSKPSKPSKSPASSARKRYPNKPNTRHSRTQKPPQGHSNGSRAPHGRSNGFLYAFKAAVCQASNAPKPSKTLQTLQKSGQLRKEKVPQQAQHAPLPHAKATTRPQQWLKSTPRPQQWLLIRVQGCRLPGLKRSKTLQNPPKVQKSALQTLQKQSAMASYTRSRLPFAGQLRKEKVPQQAQHAPLPHAKATTRPQQWLKGTPRPQQWLLIRVQGCRLPGLKRSKTLQNPPNPPKAPASSAGKRYPNKPNTRHCRTQKPPQGHSNGSRAPHGRSNGFLYAFKAAVCQASNAPKPSKPSKSPASSARKRYPNKPNTRHSRTQKPPQGHSNGSRAPHGRSNGFLYAFKAAVCQASNAPKPSKPSKSPASSARKRGTPQGKGTPTSPTRATPARKSHHKATAMAQEHPTAAAMASYTRSRLPFARPQTLQNPPKPSKSPASSAGKRYPNKPNTRHCRTQKPPQGHSNGSRAPHGRSNGFLYAFKAAVCQASNAPNPSKPSKSPPSSAGKRYPNKPNTRHSRTQKPPQGHSNGSRAPHGRSNGFL